MLGALELHTLRLNRLDEPSLLGTGLHSSGGVCILMLTVVVHTF